MPITHWARHVAQATQRRLSRFSMRTLLVLMSICCVAMGVWSVYVQPFRDQAASLAKVAELGGKVTSANARGPAWQRWLVAKMVGPDRFSEVQKVDLRGCLVTATDLPELAGLRYLQSLYLDRAEVTDENIAALAKMTELERLSLTYTQVSDAGLARLANFQRLQSLYLTGTSVSNRAIDTLRTMPSLRELYVRWTNISADGALKLHKELPRCAIHHHEIQRLPIAAASAVGAHADALAVSDSTNDD